MTAIPAATRLKTLPESGIRTFDIGRDLRPVAELIADAFAHELDQRGESALREMRLMSNFSSIIKFLNRSTGEFEDYFGGFVWLEEGKVVGNVTVQRAERSGGRWQIANVAVSPAWRGRHIARRLMERALEYISDEGGKYAVLQVYAQNQVARTLYESIDFHEVSGQVEMKLERLPKIANRTRLNNFYSFSSNHWQPLYDLVNSQLGNAAQWWRPVRRAEFQLTFEQQFIEWLWKVIGRQRIYRRCFEHNQRFEAALILHADRWRSAHKIDLWVRPEQYGQYEEGLMQWALATLQDYPRNPVRINVSKEHQAAVDVLENFGFQQIRTLLTMKHEIVKG